jgi:hypothetical protein
VFRGDKLIRDVYNALRANDELWERSLLVITYDEHGGFYDHVEPPSATPPDNRTDQSGFKFDKLGVRVPAVLVSPWLDKGLIHDTFDHTSVLKFVVEKWGLTNLLGNRVASPTTNTFAKHLRNTPRATFGLLPLTSPPALLASPEGLELSDHQKSLIELGHYLAGQITDPDLHNALTVRPALPTPTAQGQLAVEQFRSFIADRAKQRPESLAAIVGLSMTTPPKSKARKAKSGKRRKRKGRKNRRR